MLSKTTTESVFFASPGAPCAGRFAALLPLLNLLRVRAQ